jgi:DNA ligase-1
LSFCVFDGPDFAGGFEDRLSRCEEVLTGCEIAGVLKHEFCRGAEHLDMFFAELVAKGAEGIMLRRSGSDYERRRSGSLLKYKPCASDEAEVVGHQPGEGKHVGRLGALVCRWGDKIFNLGTGFSDDLRQSPPAIGAHVSFLFQGLTDGGIPRFPVFMAERNYE